MRVVRSYAKINWSLRILGKRPDGFHDLETVFQTISLHDEMTFREADSFSFTCDDPAIPADESNLVVRAARALGTPPAAIELRKRIPAGGGLGGGSSNAAATLQTLDEMFSLGRPDLAQLALSLGSDVPFFLLRGKAYATGRGEILEPLPASPGIPLLLVLPEERVLTKDAFAAVTHFSRPLGRNGYSGFANYTNDFEGPVFARIPRLAMLRQRLREAGAEWASMTGSGSTLVGAFASSAARDRAAGLFEDVRVECCETL